MLVPYAVAPPGSFVKARVAASRRPSTSTMSSEGAPRAKEMVSAMATRVAGACPPAGVDSERRRERQRVDGTRSAPAQLPADHRERPAAEAQVVEQQATLRRRLAGDAKRAADVGRLQRGVGHLALGRPRGGALQQREEGDPQRLRE